MAHGERLTATEEGIIAAFVDPSGKFVLSAYQPPVEFDRLYEVLELEDYPVARVDFAADVEGECVQLMAYRKKHGSKILEYHQRQAAKLGGYTAVKEVIQMPPRTL